jgi:hypothetical protein
MAHATEWVPPVQLVLGLATLILSVRSMPDNPGFEKLSLSAKMRASFKEHPRQRSAAMLCAILILVGFLFYL